MSCALLPLLSLTIFLLVLGYFGFSQVILVDFCHILCYFCLSFCVSVYFCFFMFFLVFNQLYGRSFRFFASNYILIWIFHSLLGWNLTLIGTTRMVDSILGSILHSVDCLLSLFLAIWVFCSWHVSEFSPSTGFFAFIRVYSFSSRLGVPNSWWCLYWFLILLSESHHRRSIIGYFHCKMWFSMIFFLSGGIHLNPGPPVQINFAHPNICSASSVTAQLNKPVVLAEFFFDHNIEILSLSETWLFSDALPSTLNALTPPNFSIVHQPRLTGKGGGVAIIYCSFL